MAEIRETGDNLEITDTPSIPEGPSDDVEKQRDTELTLPEPENTPPQPEDTLDNSEYNNVTPEAEQSNEVTDREQPLPLESDLPSAPGENGDDFDHLTGYELPEDCAMVNAADIDTSSAMGMDDPNFWNHHNNTKEDYMDLASHLPEVQSRLEDGEALEDLYKDPEIGATAYQYYNPDKMVRVEENPDGTYSYIDDGRHRITAAQELGYDMPVKIDNYQPEEESLQPEQDEERPQDLPVAQPDNDSDIDVAPPVTEITESENPGKTERFEPSADPGNPIEPPEPAEPIEFTDPIDPAEPTTSEGIDGGDGGDGGDGSDGPGGPDRPDEPNRIEQTILVNIAENNITIINRAAEEYNKAVSDGRVEEDPAIRQDLTTAMDGANQYLQRVKEAPERSDDPMDNDLAKDIAADILKQLIEKIIEKIEDLLGIQIPREDADAPNKADDVPAIKKPDVSQIVESAVDLAKMAMNHIEL